MKEKTILKGDETVPTQEEPRRDHVSAQVVIPVVIIILGSAFGNLSQTAMNAMFGGIAADFQVDMALGQWVTTLYMLVIGPRPAYG